TIFYQDACGRHNRSSECAGRNRHHGRANTVKGSRCMRVLMSLALFCWTSVAIASAEPAPRIPLVPGLTVVTAISDRQGDYESIKRIESANFGSLRLRYSGDLPKPHDLLDAGDDSQPRPTVSYTVRRTILRKDLVDSHN